MSGRGSKASPNGRRGETYDVVCLSHLRWDFVWQRPQQLMTRCARERRVFFVEEPVDDAEARLVVRETPCGVHVAVPHMPASLPLPEREELQGQLLDQLLRDYAVTGYVLWFHTPMAVRFTDHLKPLVTVYDCMDELSGFADAPPQLLEREQRLFERADLVFTGGHSLYEAKRERHANVHLFPSSVDTSHFAAARSSPREPADQAAIARPRLGFFGVVDERMALELIAALARASPDWQLVFVRPVAKIDPASLPQAPNIHYLGQRAYSELPAYLAGWDVALLPFARNESTRFISPTKLPEYLAAGRPVVSTSIRDVVRLYAGTAGWCKSRTSPSTSCAPSSERWARSRATGSVASTPSSPSTPGTTPGRTCTS